jgi:hypothetical protein
MPKIKSREIAVIMDMAGCPNRCKHCWLGHPPNRRVSEDTFRWVVKQFRDLIRPGQKRPFAKPLTAMTWYREPDYAPNYRELWELEKELSDKRSAKRFELLSIWRLARDQDYAQWASDIGTEICQISFFDLEETTDYFTGRHGSFNDSLLATERLVAVGIRPRWQLFLNKRLIPELESFVELIGILKLEKQVRDLGHEFEVFLHPIAPDGEAFNIEHLRPTVDVLSSIPSYLIEKTKDYLGASTLEECLGKAEQYWIAELSEESKPFATFPPTLAFMVTPELDVFSNLGEPMPWWRLGNLETDGMDKIMYRYENDEVLGLRVNFHIPVSQLAQEYGRKDSQYIYTRDDLILRWLRIWGEECWQNGGKFVSLRESA